MGGIVRSFKRGGIGGIAEGIGRTAAAGVTLGASELVFNEVDKARDVQLPDVPEPQGPAPTNIRTSTDQARKRERDRAANRDGRTLLNRRRNPAQTNAGTVGIPQTPSAFPFRTE